MKNDLVPGYTGIEVTIWKPTPDFALGFN
jgi:hypothetical protein